MSITVTINGSAVSVMERSLKISSKVNQRASPSFTVYDAAGTALYKKGMPVVITDSGLGVLFEGYVDAAKASNLYPQAANKWQITCKDMIWLADKRVSNSLYANQYTGMIACDQVQTILSQEGVWGAFALDYNHQLTDWTPTENYGTDTFIRANQSGWGTASDGQTWALVGSGTMTATIASDEGTLSGVANSDTVLQFGSKTVADVEAVCRVTGTNFTLDRLGPILRVQNATNWYQAAIFNGNLTISKMVSGALSTVAHVAFASTNGAYYWIRYHVASQFHYVRAWRDGSVEPIGWQVIAQDSSFTVAGGFGMEGWSSSAADTLCVDHLTVQTGGLVVATTNNGDGNPGDGDLELAPAGLAASFSEVTQTDFNLGFLQGLVSPVSGGLTFFPTQAIKFQATMSVPGDSYTATYVKFFSSGSYVIPATFPTLSYAVWIASSCPSNELKAVIDFVCTDGTSFHGAISSLTLNPDQQGISGAPTNDLTGLANDQWYYRTLPLYGVGSLAGKTLSYATVVFAGAKTGTYTAYFRDVSISNYDGTSAQSIFGPTDTSTQTPPTQLLDNGYSQMTCTVVTSYERYGMFTSPSFSPAAAGLCQSSYVDWQATLTLPPTVPPTLPPPSPLPLPTNGFTLAVVASVDNGATYLPCTLNGPIPGLLPGMSLGGTLIVFQYQLTNNGNDPTLTPLLSFVKVQVQPSYACVKSDSISTTSTQAQWQAGTLTNLTVSPVNVDWIQLNGFARNWDYANYLNQTLYGLNGPGQGILNKSFYIQLNTSQECKSRLDFAGSAWQNFTMECDIYVTSAAWIGVVYRTTGWQNNPNTSAYIIDVTTTQIKIGYGTNSSSGAGAYTNIAQPGLALTSGQWHRLKVVVNGNNHQVFLDGVLYINVNDATYAAAGYVGLRQFTSSNSNNQALYDNFGIVAALSGTWVSPAIDIHALGTISNSEIITEADPVNMSTITSTLTEISLNNGSTWATCTNGAQVPGLAPGTNVSSMTQVLIRLTISATSAATDADANQTMPAIQGVTLSVLGAYNSTGVSIGPALSLAGVANAATALVNWNDNLPNVSTAVAIATSIDGGSSWQSVAAPGNALSGITLQPQPFADTFTVNDSASYTQTDLVGGGLATWTWDTANAQLLATQSTGVDGLLEYSGLTGADMVVLGDFSTSDSGGLIARLLDTSHCYFCSIADASAASNANTVKLYKWLPGVGSTTPLTVYCTNQVSPTLASANTLYSTLGSPVVASANTQLGTATGYGEIVSQGTVSAWAAGGSIGSPTGKGFLWSVTTLEGQQILAGAWTGALRLNTAGTGSGTITADIHVRAYKRSSGGVYTQIIDMLLAAQSISTTATNFSLAGTMVSATTFATGDKLFLDLWLDVTANGHGSGQQIVLHSLSTDTNTFTGVANASAGTPGYQPSSGGVATLLGSAAITFHRATYHRFLLSAIGTTIAVSMDGAQLISVTDSGVSGVGASGVLAGLTNGHTLICSQFRVQPQGQNVGGLTVLTKATLTSTDPTNTPQLLDVATFVADPTIGAGVLIPSAQYQGTYVSANIDDCNKKSNYWWAILATKQFMFQAQNATPAPWIVQSSDSATTNILLAGFSFEESGALYRNQQVLLNVNATVTQPQLFTGDGQTRSWTLTSPVATGTAPAILLNGIIQAVGVKGIDSGRNFYYQVGSTGIDQSSGGAVLENADQLFVIFTGSYLTTLTLNNTGSFAGTTSQSQYAAIETGTSGIVANVVDMSQDVALTRMNTADATVYGNSLLQRYGVIGRTMVIQSLSNGLVIGQQTGVFFPALHVNNAQMLVSQVDVIEKITMQGGVAAIQYYWAVTLVEGPALDSWQKVFGGLFG